MSTIASPPPDATGTSRGLLSAIAQNIGGVKTFLAAIIASAGVQLAALWNTNGATAGHVMIKVGTSTPDGTVSSDAKLVSGRTGINATEVEKFYVFKDGTYVLPNSGVGFGVHVYGRIAWTFGDCGGAVGWISSNQGAYWYQSVGTGQFFASHTINAPAISLGTLAIAGAITDASASPGNASINSAKGRAAVANGASNVVITNNTVTTNSVVIIEWEDDPGQRHRIVPAAGSFTLTLSAAAAANVKFRFFVVG